MKTYSFYKPLLKRLVVFVIFAALFLQSCAPASTTQPVEPPLSDVQEPVTESETDTSEPAQPQERVSVKVVTLPFITFAQYYIALKEGYFAEQGLDVELVNMTVQEEIMPALSSGQVDVSSGLLSSGMLNAIARGAPVKITSDKGFVNPEGCVNWAILGRGDLAQASALQTPDQLNGLTVNIVPATWLEFYLTEVLASGGLSLDSINKVNLSSPAVPDALGSAQIDVAVNSEPWVTRLNAAGHPTVLPLPQELMPNSTAAVQLYGPNLLGENAEAGVRFMIAYLKGVMAYNEGKTERNLQYVAEFTELDRDLLENMCWPDLKADGSVNLESILQFQDWALGMGYMDNPVPVEQFFEGSFIEQANQSLDGTQ